MGELQQRKKRWYRNYLDQLFFVVTPFIFLQKSFLDNGDECFYGVCYYCKKAEAACAKGNIMEGSVTIWLPIEWSLGKMRHPWQRTYNSKKARSGLQNH